jgi:asparagine synthase (glutamine-hydrolysing)
LSGICGVCEPGGNLGSVVEQMLPCLIVASEEKTEITRGASIALGVARRWSGQEVAAIPRIRIAIDADLYNVNELRQRLASSGTDAATAGLAECLAYLYENEGMGFLERLNGVFSIAIWDERKQRLILAIDRLGAKALYWSLEGKELLFSTRLSAIRAARKVALEVNPASLAQYLLFSAIPHPMTAYRGVEKLAPGTYLTYESGRVRQTRYWDLQYVESKEKDERRWAEQVQAGMRAAVHTQLDGCSSENTGAYLSGGTDSSSVVAFISERYKPVKTFSIFFGEAEYSEAKFARTTAAHFQCQHFEKQINSDDGLKAISKIAEFWDEPFANSSAFGAYYCALLAKDNGIETLLAGDGGDELFAGNSRYADDKKFAVYHALPAWLRRRIVEPLTGLLPANDGYLSLPRKYVRRACIPNPKRILSYNFFLNAEVQTVFEPDFLAQTMPESWLSVAEGHFQSAQAISELNRLLYLDVKMTLADNDLRKVSGTAELAGVRVRYPLLDYRLAELSGKIPTELKLKGFEKRYIFKKAMEKILPQEVLYKKKHGFGVPLSRWLLHDRQLNQFMKDVLNDRRTRQRGYFRPAFFDHLLTLHQQGHAGFYGEVLWHILALELWHRHHFDTAPGGRRAV